ncbi:MAG: hypothetical protein AAGI17_04840 [Planctomycetota bacterium]
MVGERRGGQEAAAAHHEEEGPEQAVVQRRVMIDPHAIRRGLLLAASAGAVLAVPACSTPESVDDRASLAADGELTGEPFAELVRLSERQSRGEKPEPKGLPGFLRPIADADPELADLPLAETLEQLAAKADTTPAVPESPDRSRALLAYASGRSATIAGELNDAIRQLERAAQLDGDVPEIWRALGDARLADGLRVSAVTAYRRAASLGLREKRPLVIAAVDALDRRQYDDALRWLATAIELGEPDADSAINLVANASLGRALLATNRWRAGAEAIERSLSAPTRLSGPTVLARELSELSARRSALLRDAGDAWVRAGEYERADEVYATASEVSVAEAASLRARRTEVAQLLGRPAQSALLLFRRIADAGSVLTASDLRLVGELAVDADMRRAMRSAIADLRRLADPAEPGVLVPLARAEAAIAGGVREQRRELIAALAERAPIDLLGSEPIAVDLVRTCNLADAEACAAVAIDAVRAEPQAAAPVSAALAKWTADPRALLEALTEGPADLRASVLLELGRATDAAEVLRAAIDSGETTDATPGIAVRAAVASGAWGLADDAVRLAGTIEDSATRARSTADVMWSLRRPLEALTALAPVFEDDSVDAADFNRGAGFALLAGRLELAADMIDRAAAMGPRFEPVFETRLVIAQRLGGEGVNEPVTEVFRDLRETLPGAKLVRRLGIEERVNRGLVDDARRDLLELLDADPTDQDLLVRAVAVIQAGVQRGVDAAQTEAMLDRLQQIASDHPGSVAAATALVDGRLAIRDAQGAADALEAFGERTGSPSFGPRLERLQREALGEAGAADAARDARLAAEQLPPGQAIERLGQRANQAAPVEELLAEANRLLPSTLGLEGAERIALGRVVQLVITNLSQVVGVAEDAITRRERADTAVELVEWALEREALLAPAAHEFRIRHVVDSGADVDRLARAIDDAGAGGPQLQLGAFQLALQLLRAQGSTQTAIDTAIAVAGTIGSPLTPLPDGVVPISIELLWQSGDVADTRAFIDAIRSRRVVSDAVESMWRGFGLPSADQPGRTRGAVELAYLVAGQAYSLGDLSRAERIFELALEYDDAHPWTGNDFGYLLLERGAEEDVVRAEQLIEMAANALPLQASVTDSLGWLRYRIGVLESEFDEQGNVAREGAVSLLERADRLAGENDDGVITDHLGDAYYMAGDEQRARETWTRARRQAVRSVGGLTRDSAQFNEVQDRIRNIASKLEALRLGERPPVAPSSAEPPDGR